ALGPDGVRERSRILGKLERLELAHIDDALDGARALVAGKLLIAEDGKTFLETELEPIAAGDAVAGPAMEVFVRDDAFYRFEDRVGRGLGGCEDQPVVEDVEALVLHRAHVEIGHGNNVEHIEIVLAAEADLVPSHGAFQRVEGPFGAGLLAVLDVNAQ